MISASEKYAYRLLMVQNLVPAVSGSGWKSFQDSDLASSLIRNGGFRAIMSDFSSTPCVRMSQKGLAGATPDLSDLPQAPIPKTGSISVDR